ncbi:MAG TPA: hypothetical protein VNY10_07270 [Roseiarcus sp.]|nr:hypothetical protein [Roseiarcus sp.]
MSVSSDKALAAGYTAGVLALLKHYVRNWGRSPEQRELNRSGLIGGCFV